jgi:hypothetical protein
MASRIKAIGAYRPRIELGNTAQKAELVRQVARSTNLTEGVLDLAIKELRDTIIEMNRAGRPVKIEGLGTWTPNIGLDGVFDIQYRADTALNNALNTGGTFSGTIKFRENIGKTSEELVAMWNQEHPDDLVNVD